ncbi:penicillin acylase family protein [Modestobacter sp. VKM Ac-2985]|uniref:penicillin acylase family protein n=1 Tax=Modestobacter sp. VKM Ac-2985 TaxID=3004139 RepID=UPI0022AB722D|nr:penicillin acylase family protein [Modestobacter sp. VKM Ac-2985]MCZ2836215.1 penicillin acylase family protein [Modestobacter sp. VKM Ac-2985]
MTAPAGVTRDPWGVPTVRAGSLDDLAWAQGRVTAVDRAWQLEVERWRSEATLAAHVGAAGLSWDTFAARARLDDTARRCHDALDPDTRCWVAAYVAGVRDGLAEGAARSPELQALGLPRGGHGGWQPWTPLGIFLVHHVLFGSLGTTVWRGHLLRSFGPRLGPDLAAALGLGPPDGSNAVAVTGSRTASGLPLVAGDPHRVLERPGVYQQVHLVVDGPEALDVVGLAFPGVPGVAHFGHTGTVAWAVTNAMAVHQDLYRERLRRDGDRLLALGPDGWEPAETATVRLAVRDGEPVTVETVETARGPVVVPSWSGGEVPEALSLRAPSRVDAGLGFEALPRLLRARIAGDVEAALASWVEPVNSVLVADTTGDVRQLVAGRVPDRAAANRWHPVPAWDRAHAWRGTCPPPAGLRVSDGAPWDGVAVTANDARPDVVPYGTVFAAPHRAARLRALVGDRTGLRVDDLAELLVDTASPATGLLDALRRATAPETGTTAARLRAELLAWDGRMDADSHGAGAFAAWRSALVRRVLELPLLAPLHHPTGAPEVLAPWLSPVERVGTALERLLDVLPRHGVDLDALLQDALADAATTPAPAWGSTHRLLTVHSLDGTGWEETVVRPADGLPLSGDTTCVLATASLPGLTDRCLRGPVARYVWDLADRDASRWVVPLGADGVPGPHAEDQTPLWARGSLIPVPPADLVPVPPARPEEIP